MTLLPLVLLLHAAPLPENTVAIVAFQGSGKVAELTSATQAALAKEVEARSFGTLAAAEVEKQQRSAAMCGEDAECLATLGRVAKAGWVLAIGLGTAGKATLFTAVLVNTETGKVQQRYESKTKDAFDASGAAKVAVEKLFAGVTLREPPPPPPIVEVTPTKVEPKNEPPPPPPSITAATYKFRPVAVGLGVGAGVAAITGAIMSVVAATNFAKLPMIPASDRPAADGTQRAFNLTADVAIGVAIAAGVTMLVLLLIDGPSGGTP